MNEQRIGKFRISHALLDNNWQKLLPIMATVVIVRAESLYERKCVEYVGYSMQFDLVQEGVKTPEYTATFDLTTKTVTWNKL